MDYKTSTLVASFLGLTSALIFAAEHPDTDGWKELFGTDLSNSVDPGKWGVTDGTPNKFAVARKGPIGLQGLHEKAQAPVYYRHIKIKPLD